MLFQKKREKRKKTRKTGFTGDRVVLFRAGLYRKSAGGKFFGCSRLVVKSGKLNYNKLENTNLATCK